MIEMVKLSVRCVVLSESVVHVLWECSSYSTCGDNSQEALKQFLGARYAEFETLSAIEKTSYVLGKEDDFDALLHLVKEFIVAVWEVRKQKLYGDNSHPGQLHRQSSARDRGPVAGVGGRVAKSVSQMVRVRAMLCMLVCCVCNVCGSAHSWSMVVLLGQPFEYYHRYRFLSLHQVSLLYTFQFLKSLMYCLRAFIVVLFFENHPSFVLIGGCVSELHAPYRSIWPEAVYCCSQELYIFPNCLHVYN